MSEEPAREVIEALAVIGVCAWRNHAGSVRVRGGYLQLSPEGTPDIIGYLPGGRMLALELKMPKKRPTEAQEAWLERARAAGVMTGVVTCPREAVLLVRSQMMRDMTGGER